MEGVSLKSLRDRPFELLAELERRGRAVSASQGNENVAGREWVGVALRMAGELFLAAREETREVLSVPPSITRVPGAFLSSRLCSSMFVRIPPTMNSSSARRIRTIASARDGACTITFARSES